MAERPLGGLGVLRVEPDAPEQLDQGEPHRRSKLGGQAVARFAGAGGQFPCLVLQLVEQRGFQPIRGLPAGSGRIPFDEDRGTVQLHAVKREDALPDEIVPGGEGDPLLLHQRSERGEVISPGLG